MLSSKKNFEWKKTLTVENILIFLVGIIVLSVSWHRLSLGTELTDEAFYIADMSLVASGAMPFSDVWNVASGSAFLFSWLIPVYKFIIGSTAGLFLFMRHTFFIFKMLLLFSIYCLLHKYFRKQSLVLFIIVLIPLAPLNIFMFSYNTLPILFSLLAGALILNVVLSSSMAQPDVVSHRVVKRTYLFTCLSGMFMAFVALSHPPQVIIAVLLALCFYYLAIKNGIKLILPSLYCVAGIVTAAIFVVIVIVFGGGIHNFLSGIGNILDGAYFKIVKPTLVERISELLSIIKMYIGIYLLDIIVIIIAIYTKKSSVKSNKEYRKLEPLNSRMISIVLYWIITIVNFGYILLLFITSDSHPNAPHPMLSHIEWILFLLPLVYTFLIDNDKQSRAVCMLLTLWLPAVISLQAVSFSNISSMGVRSYLFYIPAMLMLLYSTMAQEVVNEKNIHKSKFANRFANIIGRYAILSFACLLIIISSVGAYSYVYRDEPYQNLEIEMERGLYKGIYTTQSRSTALLEVEKVIREYTSSDEKVLFMDNNPMGYLMTSAKPCTPSTWDPMQYSYGFNDDTIMKKYFNRMNTIPDKIIYINYGRDEIMSIDTDDYKFNDFVNENYHLEYENRTMSYPILVYNLNDTLQLTSRSEDP